jgi:hypothetical protein
LTDAGTSFSNFLKFSMNICREPLRLLVVARRLGPGVPRIQHRPAGTPGQLVGISRLNTGWRS